MNQGRDASAVEDWLGRWTPDQRRQVEQLADVVHRAASVRIESAIKWDRLTFSVDQDWHHWLCGIAVTRAGVRLVFHKGSLLDDPTGLLRGSGRYVRELDHQDALRDPRAAKALVNQAIARRRDMLPTDK